MGEYRRITVGMSFLDYLCADTGATPIEIRKKSRQLARCESSVLAWKTGERKYLRRGQRALAQNEVVTPR